MRGGHLCAFRLFTQKTFCEWLWEPVNLELLPSQVVHGVVVVARAQFIDKWRETCERRRQESVNPLLFCETRCDTWCGARDLSPAAATVALIRADSAAFYLFYCGRYKSVTLIQGNILKRGSTRVDYNGYAIWKKPRSAAGCDREWVSVGLSRRKK
jgi:hypothetical protein